MQNFQKKDIIYISKIFTYKADYGYPLNADKVIRGGTGYYITDGYAVPITWEKFLINLQNFQKKDIIYIVLSAVNLNI